ncbi:MAG TPA: ABC transporter ATP-binding protein [Symbiobacteriaceae bacterium]
MSQPNAGPIPADRYPLVIRGLTKTYPGASRPAVQAIDLEVQPGEILTLLGPSGCGKTTTLRLIAGLEEPDQGEIRIFGRTVYGPGVRVPAERRGLGMVFQEHALFPHLSVAENVAFGLHRLSRAERKQRVQEVLRLVGLAGLENRMPHHLSGGQQQRVALARALAPRPHLVLMDEPFSNLDAALRVQMREEVRRILKEHGSAGILVTHDQTDALAISDRIAVMNGGQVERYPPGDLHRPPHGLCRPVCGEDQPPLRRAEPDRAAAGRDPAGSHPLPGNPWLYPRECLCGLRPAGQL